MNLNLSFAKIVATPTSTAWSQAYNAGSLFGVVSLTTNQLDESAPLNTTGKQIINNLEAEFFTLETKDLTSIKNAVEVSIADVPEALIVSITIAYVKENVLYVVLAGPGSIMLKRQETIGALLANEESGRTIVGASGYMQNNDILILQTPQFAELVAEPDLRTAFELPLPSDMAESLTPNVHSTENGAASAIIIHFRGPSLPNVQTVPDFPEDREEAAEEKEAPASGSTVAVHEHTAEPVATHEEVPEDADEPAAREPLFAAVTQRVPRFSFPHFPFSKRLAIFVPLAIILAAVLIGSVIYSLRNQQDAERKAAFERIYAAAQKEYEEGAGLLTLNPNFAREDLLAAKKTVEDALPQFPEGTEERQKLQALLQQINGDLVGASQARTVKPKEVTAAASPVLAALKEQKDAKLAAADDETIYTITTSDIYKIENGDPESIIRNDNDWSDVAGFAAYNGNVYVLDRKKGLLKFVAAADGYGISNYFTDTAPNLSNASGMAIDGSVWILVRDGSLSKYTKGAKDAFTIKGLDTPFKNPTAVYTDSSSQSLFVLDSGNNRLVQIGKDGTYKAHYNAAVFATARALVVNEPGKKAYVLQNNTIYEISL